MVADWTTFRELRDYMSPLACIRSSCYRIGFYAKIQTIISGAVCSLYQRCVRWVQYFINAVYDHCTMYIRCLKFRFQSTWDMVFLKILSRTMRAMPIAGPSCGPCLLRGNAGPSCCLRYNLLNFFLHTYQQIYFVAWCSWQNCQKTKVHANKYDNLIVALK